MNKKDLDVAIRIGYSKKDPDKTFGFRGIGIWSGIAVADTVWIITKKKGMDHNLVLQIDAKSIRKDIDSRASKSLPVLLSEHVSTSTTPAPLDQHGTQVGLENIVPELRAEFESEKVRSYMSQYLPVDLHPEFVYKKEINSELRRFVNSYRTWQIFLNDQQIFRPPSKSKSLDPTASPTDKSTAADLEKPKFGSIKNQKNEIIGYYWACLHSTRGIIRDVDQKGLVFKLRNFTVGDRFIIPPLIKGSPNLLDWAIGEVHVINTKILPDAERMKFESSPEREELLLAIPLGLKDIIESARKKSAIETAEERIGEAQVKESEKREFGTVKEKLEAIRDVSTLKDGLERDAKNKKLSETARTQARVAAEKMTKVYDSYIGSESKEELEHRPKKQEAESSKSSALPKERKKTLLERLSQVMGKESKTTLQVVMTTLNNELADQPEKLRRVGEEILKELGKVFLRDEK